MEEPDVRRCSIADTLAIAGERWSLLILREIAYGQKRFGQIAAHTGAPRDVLTVRLRSLEASGLIERQPYSKARSEYILTDAGAELAPVLWALKEWGDRRLHPNDEPLVLTHDCGQIFHPVTICAACRREAEVDAMRPLMERTT